MTGFTSNNPAPGGPGGRRGGEGTVRGKPLADHRKSQGSFPGLAMNRLEDKKNDTM